jgi:hypothetical protein
MSNVNINNMVEFDSKATNKTNSNDEIALL